VESTVRADRFNVWVAASTIKSVHRELSPFVRMTDPTDGAPFDAEPWRTGSPVIWQLLSESSRSTATESDWSRCLMGVAYVSPRPLGSTASGGTSAPCWTIPAAASCATPEKSSKR
jgi:hypothetical protein